MRFIVNGEFYQTYEDAKTALGGEDNIPNGLPIYGIVTWEIFRDGNGNGVLIAYSYGGTVIQYFHAYYDAVQEIWRWQL